jgi:hypothetical protein
MKHGVFWDVTPCGSCRTDVSEEPSASFIRVTKIDELGTTLAATRNRRTLRSVRRLLIAASVVPSSPILVNLMKEALGSPETSVLIKPHGITSQKRPFFTGHIVGWTPEMVWTELKSENVLVHWGSICVHSVFQPVATTIALSRTN